MADIKTTYYNNFANETLTKEDLGDNFYSDLGELSGVMPVTDDSYIKINGKKYNHKDRDISIGNNGHIKAPVFDITDDNHLMVANLYLAAEAKDGVAEVVYGNEQANVTLEGLDNGDVLTIARAIPMNTQDGRKNEVTLTGNKIVEKSNNGKHLIGVILQADGNEILDESETVYALNSNGDLGITSPEAFGSDKCSYGIYMKYKAGDYEAADVGTKTYNRKLIVPGKGSVNVTFTLQAEEYKAE